MATDVQKAAIKKKAAELMATGIPMGQAAQEAYKQVMAIEPVETRVEKATKEAELDFAKKQLDFETTRSRYVSKKSADFQKSGVDPATATQLANEEFDKNFMAPEVSPYEGTPPVKPSVPATSEIMQPTAKTALRPQTFIPESGAKAEAKRAATPALLGESQGPKIDYKKLIEGYQSSGLTRDDAIKQAQGFQATYGHNLVQLAAKYKASGTIPPKNVAQEALDITLKDLQDLPTKLSDKSTYIKDAATKGIQDPLILAFSKQYEAGEGIPNLNEAQGKYVARVAELERKDAYERLKKEYEGKPIIVPDPTVSETRGGTKRTITLQGDERDKWLQSQAAGQVQTPWWTDPAEVKRRLAEPEKYGQQGVLTQETPLGSKQESTTGWLIRSALSPLNAVAGVVTPLVFEGLPFDIESLGISGRQAKAIAEEGRRAARPEAYKDSPVLYNIAQGRGFVGEAKDISDALGLDLIPVAGPVTLGTIYTAGLFAADMLDPTLDIVAAADKGAAAAFKASALAKEAGVGLKVGEAAKFGAKTAIEDFRSENAVASLFKKKGITPGDARLLIAEKMVPEAEAAVGKRALEGTELSKEAERLGDVDKAIESSPLLKQTVNDVKSLRASVEGLEGEKFITYDKLNEAMLEAEARNPTLLKDYGMTGEDFVKFLADKPEALKEVENALIRQSLRRGVFEATKGSIVDNKLVALTPNVFVSQDVAAKVMSDWSKSDLGQTISNLKNNPTFGKYAVGGKDKVAKPVVVISQNTKLANGESLVENISNYLDQARLSGKHSAVDWSGFQKLPNGDTVVPLDVVRNVIDLKLEDAAKSFSYVSGRDISRLEPLASKAYTTPLETRDFSFSNLKKFTQAAIKKPSSPLTPVQEAFVDEVVSKVNNLDKQLRSDMTRIIKDPSFREAYGVPENLYDRNGLVGYLIAGPNSELQGLKDTLKTSVDNIFSSERYEPSIFNNIDGLDRKTYSDIWSDAGRTKLHAEIEKTANRIAANPSTFAEELNGLTKVARELTKDEDNIIVSSSEIIDALKNKEKLPSEMLVGSYYNAETRRAYESTLNDLVEKQLGDLNVAFAHAQSESVRNWLNLVAANTKKFKNSGVEGVAGDLISKYIANSINTPGFAKKSVEEVYDIITSDIKFPMKKADKIGHADLVSFIEGESERIMKNNNLVARGDELDELLKLVKDVSKDWQNNDKAAQLKLFLGNKTGSEILSRLDGGGAKEFEKGLRSLIVSSSPNDAVSNLAKNTADTIRSIFYTSVLTAAPRFHGMNIIGAPSLIYSTTGLVPGIRDYSKAAEVMLRSDGAGGGKVILTDAAGRSYTADELWRAFSQGASRSNYDVNLPSMQAWLSNAEVVGKSEPMTIERLKQIPEKIKNVQMPDIKMPDISIERLKQMKVPGVAELATKVYEKLPEIPSVKRGYGLLMQSPNNEDLFFRIATGLTALEKGRTLDDAIKLSRAALYDVGNITKAEKKIQNMTMFYNFQRNNFVNLMKNLTTPKGWKRIVNLAKTKRGVENMLGIPDQMKQYAPSSAASRIILGRGGDYGPKSTMIVSTPIPALQSVDLLSQLIAGDIAEAGKQTAVPWVKTLFEDGREIDRVPPEQVNAIKLVTKITGAKPEDIISMLAGENVTPYRSDEPDAVDGYVYPLLSQSARNRYTLAMQGVGLLGLQRLMSDYPKTAGMQGTVTESAYGGPAGLIGYGIGLTTPMKQISAEEQRLRQVMMKTSEGRKLVGDLEDAKIEEMKTAPRTESEVQMDKTLGKAARQVSEIKSETYSELDEVIRELSAKQAEANSIQSQAMRDPAHLSTYMKRAQELMKEIQALMKKKSELEKAKKQQEKGK